MSAKATLVATLEWAAAQGRGGLRFVARDESARFYSWSEILERARRVAGGLHALGLKRGERVALVFSTSPEFFDAFFGTLLAGAVPVPLYPPVRLGRLEEYHRQTAALLTAAGARLVLAEPRVRRLLGETMALARPELGALTLPELSSAEPPYVTAGPNAPRPEELALVQFSSGTTVDPKPVALSHRAVMAQVTILNSFWPDAPEQDLPPVGGVSWLPLYHDMGLIGCVFPALERPAELTLINPEVFITQPAIWLRTLSRYRAHVSPAPNFAYGLCVSKIRDQELVGVDLSSWRVALNGAEPVAPAVLRAFIERFARWGFHPEALTPVYGLSEAALAVTFSDLERPFVSHRFSREMLAAERRAVADPHGQELVSVGRPLPGFSVEIRDDRGDRLPEGHIGRVWIAGPSLMSGYLDRPEATQAALVDGWLDTGDLGFLAGGELYLSGRAKDLVILRGRNYAPEGIERAVASLPGARLGCVVAASWLPEGAGGEQLMLFVEATQEASEEQVLALPAEVERAVLGSTGLVVDQVVVVPAGTLPRTSSGKLRRSETLRRHLAGELKPPDSVDALRLMGAFARSTWAYARLRLSKEPVRE